MVGLAVNPMAGLTLPKVHDARGRRLRPGELERLQDALQRTRNAAIGPIVHLAIETGLRRGEILNLECKEIDRDQRIARIPWSKTGIGRESPHA